MKTLTLSATIFTSLCNIALAENIPEQCSVVFDNTRSVISSFSTSKMMSGYLKDFCSVSSEDVTEIRKRIHNGDVGYGALKIVGDNDFSDETLTASFNEVCEKLERSNYSEATNFAGSDTANDLAISEWGKCVDALAAGRLVFADAFPQGIEFKEYAVRVTTRPPSAQPVQITSVAPDGIECSWRGETLFSFPVTVDTNSFDLSCKEIISDRNNILIQTSLGPVPQIELGQLMKYQNVKVLVDSFYGDHKHNSWGLIEIELFDHNGKKIEVSQVDVSSCWGNCTIEGEATDRAAKLIDSDTNTHLPSGNFFWAPSENLENDQGQWVTLHFSSSTVGSLKIHNWENAHCMKDCPANEASKLRANAKDVFVAFDGGVRTDWVRFPNSGVTSAKFFQ